MTQTQKDATVAKILEPKIGSYEHYKKYFDMKDCEYYHIFYSHIKSTHSFDDYGNIEIDLDFTIEAVFTYVCDLNDYFKIELKPSDVRIVNEEVENLLSDQYEPYDNQKEYEND